jgi:HAD superfamily hydrolase (TIGR01493 family)
MIRAIFFDLDGTLVDLGSAHRRYCLDLMDRRPDVFPHHRRLADLRTMVGGDDDHPFDRRPFSRRTSLAFPGLGLSAVQIARDHASRLAGFVEPDHAVVRLLSRLALRYRLAIVSNGSSRLQRAKLSRLGLGDASPRAFLSGELGVAKPDPALFRRALDWSGCRPAEVLFVGDDPMGDIAGAARVGMSTCWVSGGRSYPSGPPRPDRTVDRVTDLEGVLG